MAFFSHLEERRAFDLRPRDKAKEIIGKVKLKASTELERLSESLQHTHYLTSL